MAHRHPRRGRPRLRGADPAARPRPARVWPPASWASPPRTWTSTARGSTATPSVAGVRRRTLARNEVVKDPKGDRLRPLWEFRPRERRPLAELSMRLIAHRQMYTFTLNVDEATYETARPAFDALIAAAELHPPIPAPTSCRRRPTAGCSASSSSPSTCPRAGGPCSPRAKWRCSSPTAPARGFWADNVLVLAQDHRRLDLEALRARPAGPASAGRAELRSPVVRGHQAGRAAGAGDHRADPPRAVLDDRPGTAISAAVGSITSSSSPSNRSGSTPWPRRLRKSLDSFSELPGPVPTATSKRKAT